MENKTIHGRKYDFKSNKSYAIMCRAVPILDKKWRIYNDADVTFFNQHLKVQGRKVNIKREKP